MAQHRPEEMHTDATDQGKVLLVPPMEPMGARLFAASFRHAGFDSRVLKENRETLALGLKNTGGGECAPCPTTLGSLLAALRDDQIPADRALFFMPTACGPCRFGQYTQLDRLALERLGLGAVRMIAPTAENNYEGLDTETRMRLWHSSVASDVLRKIVHRVRPYETVPGSTDRLAEELMVRWEQDFAGPDIAAAGASLAKFAPRFAALPRPGAKARPIVGVVGEIYVRMNPFLNQDVCRRIEELGGEAWLSPIAEWVLYLNRLRTLLAKARGLSAGTVVERVRVWLEDHLFFHRIENRYYDLAGGLLEDRHEPPIVDVMAAGMKYVPWQFEGESLLTLGRAAMFLERNGAGAVVSAAPMFCMPGTITTSIFPRIEKEYGRPVIANFYDGSGDPNQSLVPMMHFLTNANTIAEARP